MSANLKQIKTRIGSVKNTKKITRAMQMISAVKMKKSVNAALSSRPYAQIASQLLFDIAETQKDFELMQSREEIKTVCLVIITSNKGLCGSYNSSVLKQAERLIDGQKDKRIVVAAIGQKSANFAKKHGLEIILKHDDLTEKPVFERIEYIGESLREQFLNREIDEIYAVYTNYVSALVTETDVDLILPIRQTDVQEMLRKSAKDNSIDEEEFNYDMFEFEPNKKKILESVLPTLFNIRLFQILLESSASEHSSRMMTMKAATDSASEMIEDLTLEFNKGRQAAITQEISEIAAGADAISS